MPFGDDRRHQYISLSFTLEKSKCSLHYWNFTATPSLTCKGPNHKEFVLTERKPWIWRVLSFCWVSYIEVNKAQPFSHRKIIKFVAKHRLITILWAHWQHYTFLWHEKTQSCSNEIAVSIQNRTVSDWVTMVYSKLQLVHWATVAKAMYALNPLQMQSKTTSTRFTLKILY